MKVAEVEEREQIVELLGHRFRLVDLSAPLTSRVHEVGSPKIKRTTHRRGAFLLGLGALLAWGRSPVQHLKNFFLYLLGPYRLSPKHFPEGMGLALETVTTDTHSGTHLDAPFHFGPRCDGKPAKTIEEVPLSWCFGPGVRLDFRSKAPGELITAEDVEAAYRDIGATPAPGQIPLIWTGADARYFERDYERCQPGLAAEAVGYLVDAGVKVMGIDAFGLDVPWREMFGRFLEERSPEALWPAHFVGRRLEYCHMEKMANLGALPGARGFFVCCFPVKVEKAGAGWVRAVALVPEGED